MGEMPIIPPPVLALVAGGVQHALAPDRRAGIGRRWSAGVVGVTSLGLIGASIADFRRAGTTLEPLEPRRATALVTTGANGLTRNPIYLGMTGMLLAHAIFRGGVATLLPVAGFVVGIDRLQIRHEEAALTDLFGAEYTTYRQRVPRWLGPRRR